MNSRILISPAQAWGFQPILSGKSLTAATRKRLEHCSQPLCRCKPPSIIQSTLARNRKVYYFL
ncbi:hypothetical protein [Microcoleus sp. ARI1-A2]|uniref:hypothetical protein n=1 Tax=Microcoleus sp. ARI1-A2 TaxID=2818557 RepID=UPI002FD6A314